MWSKLDDKFHSHRKPRGLADTAEGREALGLWVICLSYCGDQLTDGFVPAWFVVSVVPGRKGDRLAHLLVHAGLFEVGEIGDETGWFFHDFLDYNKSRVQVFDKRAADAKRQQEWREQQQQHGDDSDVTA